MTSLEKMVTDNEFRRALDGMANAIAQAATSLGDHSLYWHDSAVWWQAYAIGLASR